jgi:hypothetical protein
LNDYEIVDVYQDKVLKPTGKSLMLAFDPGEVKVLLLEGSETAGFSSSCTAKLTPSLQN